MKIRILLKLWRLMRCIATLMALGLMTPLVEAATAAQQNNSSKETQDKTEKTQPKKSTLRIEVLVMDPESKSPQHVEDATVKIAGEEESYATGKDGKTQSFTVPPGAKTAVVHVSSATCSIDITVKEGRQDVKVLVEKLPQVKCTLQP